MTTSIESVPPSAPTTERKPAPLPAIELPPMLSPTPKPARLVSLDVFRGITIAAMILVNNPGGKAYAPLEHADWHGWTPTDLIFPFFLFIVGVAAPFSMAKRAGQNESRGQLLAHVWARALSLFMLGELLTGIPFRGFAETPSGYDWISQLRIGVGAFCVIGIFLLLFPWRSRKVSLILPIVLAVLFYAGAFAIHKTIRHVKTDEVMAAFSFGNGLLNPTQLRIPGVLQRIGICYGVAATIALFFGWRMIVVWAIALMAIYSGLMLNAKVFANHETGSLTREDNLSRRIDEWLLVREGRWNHAYSVYPDNEGALSTLPAIATVLIGMLVGTWLRTFRPAPERGMGVLVFGLFTLLAGMALDRWLMPINKNIWTPSFTVFTAGMGMLCLGTVFYFVDVLNRRAWAWPFKVYGMNAIAAFVLSGLLVRLGSVIMIKQGKEAASLWSLYHNIVPDGVSRFADMIHYPALKSAENLSLSFALSLVLVIFLFMLLLYVCRVFVKV